MFIFCIKKISRDNNLREKRIKRFLTEILSEYSYLVTIIVEQLVPNLAPFLSEQLQFGMNISREIKKITQNLRNEVILPVMLTENEDPLKPERIDAFVHGCQVLTKKMHMIFPTKRVLSTNLEIYYKVQNDIKLAELEPSVKKESLALIDNLLNFFEGISVYLSDDKQKLESALTTIDAEEFHNTFYGTILAFICLAMQIEHKPFFEPRRFKNLIFYGLQSGRTLEKYGKTIHILMTSNGMRSIAQSKDVISIVKDAENDLFEMNFENFEKNVLYTVNYQNKRYAIKKTDDEQLVFYDIL